MKCGECCRAGYDVYVEKNDIEKWQDLGKTSLLRHLMINMKSSILKNNLNITEKDGNLSIKKKINNPDINLDLLAEFIIKNHYNFDQEPQNSDCDTISNGYDQDPILVPIGFKIMLKGLNMGLDYLIRQNSDHHCSYLKNNECLIQDIKPSACKRFPFTTDKCLRANDLLSLKQKKIQLIE